MTEKPRRVQRKRCVKLPPNTVYVGRPSKWGNPYYVQPFDDGRKTGWVVQDGDGVHLSPVYPEKRDANQRAVDLFAADALLTAACDPEWLQPLRGKNLACWCPSDLPCHADVLLAMASGNYALVEMHP